MLRHYEQVELDNIDPKYTLTNSDRAESLENEERNLDIIDEHGASAGDKKECTPD